MPNTTYKSRVIYVQPLQIKMISLFYGVIINHTLNTSYTYGMFSTPLYWTLCLVNVKVESDYWQKMADGNPELDLNEFEIYARQVLIPPNIETG